MYIPISGFARMVIATEVAMMQNAIEYALHMSCEFGVPYNPKMIQCLGMWIMQGRGILIRGTATQEDIRVWMARRRHAA
jgi:hypothetical protein